MEPIYVAVDHDPADLRDVIRFLADELGVASPPVADLASETGHKRCRNDRLVRSGYPLSWPTYREGYRPLIRELLQMH